MEYSGIVRQSTRRETGTMTARTTVKDLEQLVRIIERAHGNDPDEPIWTRRPNGENVSTVGRFYLDGAYGGYALYRIVNTAGAVSDVSRIGHAPKKELETFLRGFVAGLDQVTA
jgi:hypothetical protein